jgi:hypothetical protein
MRLSVETLLYLVGHVDDLLFRQDESHTLETGQQVLWQQTRLQVLAT